MIHFVGSDKVKEAASPWVLNEIRTTMQTGTRINRLSRKIHRFNTPAFTVFFNCNPPLSS